MSFPIKSRTNDKRKLFLIFRAVNVNAIHILASTAFINCSCYRHFSAVNRFVDNALPTVRYDINQSINQ